MAKKKIVVVGVGALGSHVVLALRNLDVDIVVVDMDRIERKNVLSQFHTAMGVGKNKVVALTQSMQGLFGRKIEGVPHELTEANVEALLSGAALVIDALDNAKSREIVQAFVRWGRIPCLHGALAADGTFGRVVWDEQFVIDSEAGMGKATCEDGAHLPFILLTSSVLALAAQRFLATGERKSFNLQPGLLVAF